MDNNRKRNPIGTDEQKQIMLDMLKYIDSLCRENNIKYSLIGGSLIGVIRHGGYIPWDDDIDIVLDYKEYHKLLRVLSGIENTTYKFLIPGKTTGYPIHFLKMVDPDTYVEESGLLQRIPNYGVFIDIFCYNSLPENRIRARIYYAKYSFLKRCLTKYKIRQDQPLHKQVIRKLKNCYIDRFGYENNLARIIRLFESNTNDSSKYVITNNPGYGLQQETQLRENIENYQDAQFENITVMIFQNYDAILRTTYGDYMTPPAKTEQVLKHKLKMWWVEGSEKKANKIAREMAIRQHSSSLRKDLRKRCVNERKDSILS